MRGIDGMLFVIKCVLALILIYHAVDDVWLRSFGQILAVMIFLDIEAIKRCIQFPMANNMNSDEIKECIAILKKDDEKW